MRYKLFKNLRIIINFSLFSIAHSLALSNLLCIMLSLYNLQLQHIYIYFYLFISLNGV